MGLGLPIRGPSEAFVRKAGGRLAEHALELRFHHVQAHDRARAVLNFVDDETKIVLLDWRPPFEWTRLRGSHVEAILRRSPARVGVLKFRGIERFERILVATAGGPYAKAEVEVADAVAELMGARVTYMMVIPMDASPARHEYAREYLDRLNAMTAAAADTVVVPSDRVARTILHAGRNFDLVVLGASRQPAYRRLIGRIPDIVAGGSDRSVLVTQDPGFGQVWRPRLQAVMARIRGRESAETPRR
jgi:nucleotide-binding universal stress UspA family protein